jgi:hypothetical protein
MEKLKKKEDILFYDEIDLFEDELADNGTAILNVKIVSSFMFKISKFYCIHFFLIYNFSFMFNIACYAIRILHTSTILS